ncbi:PucR family transcriptional regulator [Streptomyces cavernae]|uniref:PucR family transcriptional regulator n=1 Tax=Streptomyces cavernae TaxID=2259034 RepID=UPI000FEB9967|nr:PucR family transcriptional regulator [Streptomyces cavernae]
MEELAGRLTALDPDAGAAVRVIAYFDRLVEGRAGLEALVRGAAVLSGCPARLVDHGRGVRVRVEADGRRRDAAGPEDSEWPSAALTPGGVPALWLERTGPRSVVDAMVLERAASAARLVLDRTRGRARAHIAAEDPALLETLLDPTAPQAARLHAARGLGLDPSGRARALALPDGHPRVQPFPASDGPGRPLGGRSGGLSGDGRDEGTAGGQVLGPGVPPGSRVGVGPAVPVPDLHESWAAARTALRFTAYGTDPGPRTVHADELGTLALLAEAVGPGTRPPADVRALDSAGAATPWLLATLNAVVSAPSLRTAATELNLHHSTLQDRLSHAEALLGWSVRDPHGRLRLQLALIVRRLMTHQAAFPPAH